MSMFGACHILPALPEVLLWGSALPGVPSLLPFSLLSVACPHACPCPATQMAVSSARLHLTLWYRQLASMLWQTMLSLRLVTACRTQEGIKRSMHLKDAMRETCLTDLAEAWYNLLRAYQSANPDLAAAVLNTVERYVSWIDVGLVVNERYMHSLYQTAKFYYLSHKGGRSLAEPL